MVFPKTRPASINNGQGAPSNGGSGACHKPLNWVFAVLTLCLTLFGGWGVLPQDVKLGTSYHKTLNWECRANLSGVDLLAVSITSEVDPHAALTLSGVDLHATPFYGGGTPCHKALNWAVVARDLRNRAQSQKPATINNGRGALAYSEGSGSCHMTINWAPPGPMPLLPRGIF
jgi:hypothetical protein